MTNIFQKIKEELFKTASILEKFDSYSNVLQPNEISVDKLEVGGKIQKIGTNDELEPVADGDYTINNENQDKVTIKDGLIASLNGESVKEDSNEIAKDETKAEDKAEDENFDDSTNIDLTDLQTKVSDLENRVAQLETYFQDFKKTSEKQNSFSKELETQFKNLNDSLKELAKLPVSESVKETTFSKQKAKTNYEKFKEGLLK